MGVEIVAHLKGRFDSGATRNIEDIVLTRYARYIPHLPPSLKSRYRSLRRKVRRTKKEGMGLHDLHCNPLCEKGHRAIRPYYC